MTLQILLIEDDPGDAALIAAFLRQSRFNGHAPRLRVVDTLAQARSKLLESVPDLILLDLALPDSAGLATVTRVQELAPETPIVVLSGHRDAEFEAQVMEAGAQDYLVKLPRECTDVPPLKNCSGSWGRSFTRATLPSVSRMFQTTPTALFMSATPRGEPPCG